MIFTFLHTMSVIPFCFVFQYDILLGDLITEFSTLKSSQVQFSESSKLHLNERRARPLDTSSTHCGVWTFREDLTPSEEPCVVYRSDLTPKMSHGPGVTRFSQAHSNICKDCLRHSTTCPLPLWEAKPANLYTHYM